MERCAKRRRVENAPIKHVFHVQRPKTTRTDEANRSIIRNVDPEVSLAEKRALLDIKLEAKFESIFEKYGKDFEGVGDEIDIATGEIVVNNGHLLRMQNRGYDDVWQYSRKQKPDSEDTISGGSAFSLENFGMDCNEDGIEQNLREDLVINEGKYAESEYDCVEDDLILRGFVRANRFLRLSSKDVSHYRLGTIQKYSCESTMSPYSFQTKNLSGVNIVARQNSYDVSAGTTEDAPNTTYQLENDMELAWRLPKLPMSQEEYCKNPVGKVQSVKSFSLHKKQSYTSESVKFQSPEMQARRFKFGSHDNSYYVNHKSEHGNEKTELATSNYVNVVSQNLIPSILSWRSPAFRQGKSPVNLAPKEILSSVIGSEMSGTKHLNTSSRISRDDHDDEKVNHHLHTGKTEVITCKKTSESNVNLLPKNIGLVFDDLGCESNPIQIPDSLSEETLTTYLLVDRLKTKRPCAPKSLSTSSISEKAPHKALVDAVKIVEEPLSSSLHHHQTVTLDESSIFSLQKLSTSSKVDEVKISSHFKKDTAGTSYEKSPMKPKQKYDKPILTGDINPSNTEKSASPRLKDQNEAGFIALTPLDTRKLSSKKSPHIKTYTRKNSTTLSEHKISGPSKNPNVGGLNICAKKTSSLRQKIFQSSLAVRWSSKSEEIDELSLDLHNQSPHPSRNLKICVSNEIVSQTPGALKGTRDKNKSLNSKFGDDNDEDELGVDYFTRSSISNSKPPEKIADAKLKNVSTLSKRPFKKEERSEVSLDAPLKLRNVSMVSRRCSII